MNQPEAPSCFGNPTDFQTKKEFHSFGFEEFSLKFLCTTGKSHFPVRFRTGRRSRLVLSIIIAGVLAINDIGYHLGEDICIGNFSIMCVG